MKTCRLFTAALTVSSALLLSCIQKEPLNAEADILTCTLPTDILQGEPVITNDMVTALVKKGVDLHSITPIFTITEGATITPASDTPQDFTRPIKYTVTSQDGKWHKDYEVSLIAADLPTIFDFENWEDISMSGTKSYEIPYELPVADKETGSDALKMMVWSSGNAGYGLVHGAVPSDFPTCSSMDSKIGQFAAKLETKETGFAPLPIAAGNLFLGAFDASIAMSKPLSATQFGVPFNKKPITFKGYYTYTPGPVYKSGGVEIPGEIDRCNMYAILYEIGGGERLNGDNPMNDPRVIAVADVTNAAPCEDYMPFEIAFDYSGRTVQFDPVKSQNYQYYLAVVFSSSYKGGTFEGAAGSVLHVDDVEIVCE
jgi:hypothetical protein